MLAYLVALVIVSVASSALAGSLRLARIYTDNAVLQAESPCINGWAQANDRVAVRVSSGSTAETVAAHNGAFVVCLPPQKASFDSVVVTVTAGKDSVSLHNVLFGDVWACSGQSNMEFSLAEIFDADDIIRNSASDNLRLFAVQKNSSTTPLQDLVDVQEGWVLSSPQTTCGSEYGSHGNFCMPHCGPSAAVPSFKRDTWGYFSAVCYLHGRALVKKLNRPIGLLETCWGGTNIVSWSSPAALARCNATGVAGGPSILWNGMVVPLLNFPIKGAVWYQGEANAAVSLAAAELYACQMNAMIEDWRASWRASQNFTFVMAQLAAYIGPDDALPMLRQSQLMATLATPNTGMSVGLDLSDPQSPCGNVHIRNKTAVGDRMALASLNLAYGYELPFSGPVPANFTVNDNADTITVDFSGAAQGVLEMRAINQTVGTGTNFAVVSGGTSYNVSQVTVADHSVTLLGLPSGVTEITYGWSPVPRGRFLYDSAGLPATPFKAVCNDGTCALYRPHGI